MAVTASGSVIGCGQNDEGQVRPDLPTEELLLRPSLVEPVLSHRVIQVRNFPLFGVERKYRLKACRRLLLHVRPTVRGRLVLTSRSALFGVENNC